MFKRKLLLADDSVTIQKVVNLTFADEGIEVITVGDGDSAMQVIEEQSPDVVLADVHMPGLNGYQICEIVRQNPATRNLPVVLLVGSFEPFDENEAQRVGANAYLTKPFQSIRQLVSQVTELMAAAAEEETAEFVPAADLPDTTDIESLYQKSISPPETEEEPETGPPRYVDAGMDDEMIETSFAGDTGPDTDLSEEQYPPTDRDEDVAPSEFDYAPVEAESSFESVEPEVVTSFEETADTESGSPFEEAAHTEAGSSFEETTHTEAHAATASASATAEAEPYFDQFAATEQITAGDQRTERDFDLDAVELLELPPIEDGKTLEFTTTQSMIAQTGRKEVVSISPELMDIIVQKVVEKLSEKY